MINDSEITMEFLDELLNAMQLYESPKPPVGLVFNPLTYNEVLKLFPPRASDFPGLAFAGIDVYEKEGQVSACLAFNDQSLLELYLQAPDADMIEQKVIELEEKK